MKAKGVSFERVWDGQKRHTYSDWGLCMTKLPEVSPPAPKTKYIDIPGRDGSVDLSEILTGEVQYEDREIKMEFVIPGRNSGWRQIYSDAEDFLQGERVLLILDDDLSFYYDGRFKVDGWHFKDGDTVITISGRVEPYKYERYSSVEDWLWDDFSFVDGIIRDYREIAVNGEYTLHIPGRKLKVVPVFETVGELEVTYKGITYNLPVGRSRAAGIRLSEGDNALKFTGTGTVTVDYRGGRL